MDMSCVDRQDVLLAIIEAADARGLKRVHLQKAVFLVAEGIQRKTAGRLLCLHQIPLWTLLA